jgi:hypothetical protein
MEAVNSLAEVLQAREGWGVAALMAIVIWRLIAYVLKLLAYIRDQHKERIEEQGASIQILQCVKSFLAGNEKALDRFTEKLDRLSEERRP